MPPNARIMTFSEYAAIRHPTPYVVDVAGARSRLVLFGVRHSADPTDPMFAAIAAEFARLVPCFALHEGTPPSLEADREVAIRRHCEAGLLRHLAAGAAIETASMDIPLPEEARLLRAALPLGDALVYLVMRQLASFNRKTAPVDFAGYFADFFALIAPGLGLRTIDWSLVEGEHLRLMGSGLRARQVTALHTDPMRDELPTQRMARLSNRLRDEHILRELLAATAVHGRVFATVGVSHAVMLETALRDALLRR